jgi:hypothetical protein
MSDRAEAARELVLAIIRLAVCDYVGVSYGHDGPDRLRQCGSRASASDAELFLTGPWAAHLADQVGLCADVLWRQAKEQLKAMSTASLMERAA